MDIIIVIVIVLPMIFIVHLSNLQSDPRPPVMQNPFGKCPRVRACRPGGFMLLGKKYAANTMATYRSVDEQCKRHSGEFENGVRTREFEALERTLGALVFLPTFRAMRT